jgi:hypothetical protein
MDLLIFSLFRLFAVIEKIQFSERHQWKRLIDWRMGNCLLEDAYVRHLQSGYAPQGLMAAGRAFKEHSQTFLPEMNPLGNRDMAIPPRSLVPFPNGGQMHNDGRRVFGNITNHGTQRGEPVCFGGIDMDGSILTLDDWDSMAYPFHQSVDSMTVDAEEAWDPKQMVESLGTSRMQRKGDDLLEVKRRANESWTNERRLHAPGLQEVRHTPSARYHCQLVPNTFLFAAEPG